MSKEQLTVPVLKDPDLKKAGERILNGEIYFFNNQWIWLGQNYNWVTNPKTGHNYEITRHWSEINDMDKAAGDIKYVWEKSRFSYLLTIIRYDYHFSKDCFQFVRDEILSWINSNPVNQGPNWVCSQEISIRLMDWFFALHYYKKHPDLTSTSFEIILQSIYNQIEHIYTNIKFSLKTVRNNHALTESLLLYLAGHLFPFFKDSNKWKVKGKYWFQQEIDYQICDDGSYIQFSMNYHRIAVQLLTLAILFSESVRDSFDELVYDKAKKSLNFLYQFHSSDCGSLPNYGHNDGALFFPLNNMAFSDFRPQLNALHYALFKKHVFKDQKIREDVYWLCAAPADGRVDKPLIHINKFDRGGYYLFRNQETSTFVRCGSHRDRPGQADNLHLHISLNGKTLLRDAGTYQYNADPEDVNYFFGTKSHNTVMLGNADQMKKAGRFIWLYWSQSERAELNEDKEWIIFEGRIKAFRHMGNNIAHHRIVRKKKGRYYWEVEDKIINRPNHLEMRQIWHPNPDFLDRITFKAFDSADNAISLMANTGMYASGYGTKLQVPEIHFTNKGNFIKTIITLT
jgi:hypothetical protein